jgi:murein DD-endopeptidase MepM/ murein hydrolase activator NlpD
MGIVAAAWLAGCGSSTLVHRVKPGETLYRIGMAYGVSHHELARVNALDDPDRLAVGQRLRIPAAARVAPDAAADHPAGSRAFAWPVEVAWLESGYGPRGDAHHDGIDLSAPERTPVRAARAGRVVYSDRLRGYGNVVIVEHGGGWSSVYAHNRENRARAGAVVRQGEVIATLGATGRTTGPNLHFEIRKDGVARNPLHFLPPEAGVRGALTRRTGDPDS